MNKGIPNKEAKICYRFPLHTTELKYEALMPMEETKRKEEERIPSAGP